MTSPNAYAAVAAHREAQRFADIVALNDTTPGGAGRWGCFFSG